ncbi:hypothetical protein VC83_02752 [Pseudogymnoascus destructans]|uniref:Sas10 C-terminal domain-containing protein n=2 Tax=Pseudogymnoascus destructans TaxID=655981 RepID=L8G8A8_PSED2|nr:uncharacterized protein VC83_02752 [Pseudogymnoascus destructans]ELR09332.1 hypothetical protein GMDG_03898 [Pseudogymnoascus destructans 20631-21]OAF60947.1 hypothetical protein VC83_02752 [Pseudogymnoascus destructans]
MAKKRKGSGRVAPSGPKEFDGKDGKLRPITSYRDVADEEDDFHINRDKVMLDEGPEAKRQRKWAEQDAFLEPSDEEVLGYSDASSEDDEAAGSRLSKSKSNRKATSDSEGSEAEEEDEDAEGWGSSKKDYYNADNIETEVDALEEEAEAKRLQQKKLQSMSEADFGFDENEWLQEVKDDDGDVVTEILKDVEITDDLGPEERLKLLQTRYPEFEFLANEFVELHPVLEDLNNEINATGPRNTVAVMKSRALAAYLGALTMYFAVLTSTAKEEDAKAALDPMELQDHAVMDSLLRCREMWSKTKTLQAEDMPFGGLEEDEILSDEATPETDEEEAFERIPSTKKSKKAAKLEAAAAATAKARKARIDANEASLTDLSSLMPTTKTRKSSSSKAKPAAVQDSDSDFGEEESLSSRALAEKAAKKKSLRFYTSQIAQRSNKRNEAGRDAGGDADLPYRERLRDRQNRLNAEAERRGKKLDEYGRGAELGENSDEEDDADRAAGKKVQDEEDEYYDLVAQTSKAKKAMKEDKHAALVAAEAENSLARVECEDVGEDGKRAISYQIQKNKGLHQKRKKEVRNPRVKKRMKYEEKLKKLGSMKAIYKGGEERGGYSGEKTGIKAGVVKSVKL